MATIKYTESFTKNFFEQLACQKNQFVCGIDEVGRGCLAGPVVACAAILKQPHTSYELKDSKLLSAAKREQAFTWLTKNCWYAIALVPNRDIDEHNIYQATLKAMKRAFLQLTTQLHKPPNTVLVDAMPLNLDNTAYHDLPIYHFPFGEQKSSSIAAASIIAKVLRDKLMITYNHYFPGYLMNVHKGYATKKHKLALCHGISILHRKSFIKKIPNTIQKNLSVLD